MNKKRVFAVVMAYMYSHLYIAAGCPLILSITYRHKPLIDVLQKHFSNLWQEIP